MARYCVAFDTIKMFSSVAGTENLSDLVRLQKLPSDSIYILDGNGGVHSAVYIVGLGFTTSTFFFISMVHAVKTIANRRHDCLYRLSWCPRAESSVTFS